MTAYQLLGLNKPFVQGLEEMGIEHPSHAQTQFIPAVSRYDSDLLTIFKGDATHQDAYGLPLLNQIDPGNPNVQAVVLCSTREQCQQIASALGHWAQALGSGVRILAVSGGVPINNQVGQLQNGAQLLVAFPGRLVDLLTHGAVSLHQATHMVLHGADELLNSGMREALDIVLMAAENRRATWATADTITDEVRELARRYMPQVRELTIHDISLADRRIRHVYYLCRNPHRFPALKRLLGVEYTWRGFITCLTRNDGREIAEKLTLAGHPSRFVDSEMSADDLKNVSEQFQSGKYHWLTLTDVAVRSLQLPAVSVIIQYGIPSVPEVYYQRCRLLGDKAEALAISAAILTPKFEEDLQEVCRQVQVELEKRPIPTPADLTDARFRQSIQRFNAEAPEDMPAYMVDMLEKTLGKLTKSEMIARVAGAEYKRLKDKSLRETDLNFDPSEEQVKTPVAMPSETTERTPVAAAPDVNRERLFVNIGQMDGVTESTFVMHLNRALGIPPAAISNIDLKRTHIHFDIDQEYAAIVRTELPKFAVKDRAVRVDDASPSRERNNINFKKGRRR